MTCWKLESAIHPELIKSVIALFHDTGVDIMVVVNNAAYVLCIKKADGLSQNSNINNAKIIESILGHIVLDDVKHANLEL